MFKESSKRKVLTVISSFILFLSLASSAHAFQGEVTTFMYESKHVGKNDKLHKNNNRKNLLVIPHSSRPDDLTLIVWFHGLNGFTEKTFKRVMSQIEKPSREGHSIAVLIPEMPWSANTSTPRTRQGKVWQKPHQFKKFLDEGISLVRKDIFKRQKIHLKNPEVIIIGHSAGGSAIMSASIEGSLCDKRVKKIIWSDASYGSWLKKADLGCMKNKEIDKDIVVRKWDDPYRYAKKFFITNKSKSYKILVLPRKKYTHGQIGNSIIDLVKLFPSGC